MKNKNGRTDQKIDQIVASIVTGYVMGRLDNSADPDVDGIRVGQEIGKLYYSIRSGVDNND